MRAGHLHNLATDRPWCGAEEWVSSCWPGADRASLERAVSEGRVTCGGCLALFKVSTDAAAAGQLGEAIAGAEAALRKVVTLTEAYEAELARNRELTLGEQGLIAERDAARADVATMTQALAKAQARIDVLTARAEAAERFRDDLVRARLAAGEESRAEGTHAAALSTRVTYGAAPDGTPLAWIEGREDPVSPSAVDLETVGGEDETKGGGS